MGTTRSKDRNFIGFRASDAAYGAVNALATEAGITRQDMMLVLLDEALKHRMAPEAKPSRKSRSVRTDDAALFE